MTKTPQAEIHNFNGTTQDENGDWLHGFYFRFVNDLDIPLGGMIGPYKTGPEAEAACQRAHQRGDY